MVVASFYYFAFYYNDMKTITMMLKTNPKIRNSTTPPMTYRQSIGFLFRIWLIKEGEEVFPLLLGFWLSCLVFPDSRSVWRIPIIVVIGVFTNLMDTCALEGFKFFQLSLFSLAIITLTNVLFNTAGR